MAKRKVSATKYITREVLSEELGAAEQRLVAKIDSLEKLLDLRISSVDSKIDNLEQRLDTNIDGAVLSMKEYTDSRFNRDDSKSDALDRKLTKYFELMMQAFADSGKEMRKILSNHEDRLTSLEGKRN